MEYKSITPKKRILVVDDEPDILKLVEWQLMMSGYDVLTASNGTEGLKKAREEKPDLIILDVIMPIREMNGIQMNEYLKKDELTKKIPVIFFTSTVDSSESTDDEGTVMFPKSVSSEKLLNKIKELTAKKP
jgi:two-component system alkaline phosphatase synthesis response regulator PhoP